MQFKKEIPNVSYFDLQVWMHGQPERGKYCQCSSKTLDVAYKAVLNGMLVKKAALFHLPPCVYGPVEKSE